MNDIKNHLAYGLTLEQLEIVVVDDSKLNQTIIRAFLQSMKVRRMRFYDEAVHALREIMDDTPHLLIAAWQMRDSSGQKLLKMLRNQRMGQAALLPALMTMGSPTRRDAENAYRHGANAVIAKPFSLTSMQKRIQWILEDQRGMVLEGETYVISGVNQHLDEAHKRNLEGGMTLPHAEIPEKRSA